MQNLILILMASSSYFLSKLRSHRRSRSSSQQLQGATIAAMFFSLDPSGEELHNGRVILDLNLTMECFVTREMKDSQRNFGMLFFYSDDCDKMK